MKSSDDKRVIGFFAVDGDQLLLDGDACIVTGEQQVLEAWVARQRLNGELSRVNDFRARKIRLGAILVGLDGGGAYSFDAIAYARFLPFGNRHGYRLDSLDIPESTETGLALVTVRRALQPA